jgi:hypothetical protein
MVVIIFNTGDIVIKGMLDFQVRDSGLKSSWTQGGAFCMLYSLLFPQL